MTNPKLVEGIGVVDRDVRNDQISDQQLLEHIRTVIALVDELDCCAPRKLQCLESRANQLPLDPVKIDAIFDTKWADDKRMHNIYLIGLSINFSEPSWAFAVFNAGFGNKLLVKLSL